VVTAYVIILFVHRFSVLGECRHTQSEVTRAFATSLEVRIDVEDAEAENIPEGKKSRQQFRLLHLEQC